MIWKELKINYIAERFLGFTIPKNNQFYIVSYDGIHQVKTNQTSLSIETEKLDNPMDLFDEDLNLLMYKSENCSVLSFLGGNPLLKTNDLSLELRSNHIVLEKNKKLILSEKYENCSGDWEYTTLSEEGNMIVYCDPYLLKIYINEIQDKS